MSLTTLKNKFNSLLLALNGSSSTKFSNTVEAGYEALTLVTVMNEYKRIYGPVKNLIHPTNNKFLNQSPGRFRIDRSFKVDFVSGDSFYFAADIEVFGLEAYNQHIPVGVLFEADVVVIPESMENDVINNFNGYPAPQHIHSAFECKFGKYHKSQLRELLGLKRHLCYIGRQKRTPRTKSLFGTQIVKSRPSIALKMVRPRRLKFLDRPTASLYDLQQIIVN